MEKFKVILASIIAYFVMFVAIMLVPILFFGLATFFNYYIANFIVGAFTSNAVSISWTQAAAITLVIWILRSIFKKTVVVKE